MQLQTKLAKTTAADWPASKGIKDRQTDRQHHRQINRPAKRAERPEHTKTLIKSDFVCVHASEKSNSHFKTLI